MSQTRFVANIDSVNIGLAMWNRSFREMGIPAVYGFKQLLFSAAANALVVQTQSAEKNWRPERLYFRYIDSDPVVLNGISF